MEQLEVVTLNLQLPVLEPDLIPVKLNQFWGRGEGRKYRVLLLSEGGRVVVRISDRDTNTPILRDTFMSFEEALEYLRKELGLFVFEA
ncbi:protein of unknown function (plasmid) [Thermococcus nautili]|uniref:hypothetical protein n=1 Tax=Thermococcus nautili TaxID=195522 RepID=UPI0025549D15|nr:hypothetical protein [Thermococcus nautili]CAI1494204.1 protein of unknown function [Thermococcus nautili]